MSRGSCRRRSASSASRWRSCDSSRSRRPDAAARAGDRAAMTGYLIRRLVGVVPVLLASTAIVWVLMFLLPGDPARLMAGGQGADPEVLRAIRAEWRLDDPAWLP